MPLLSYAECPPLDTSVLWLPKDKEAAKVLFYKKAKKLNDSGKCVVEGGYGRNTNKFYITVSPTGKPSKYSKILRYSYDELKK